MPRIARTIIPGHPHHVTQRGNRRMDVFFCDEDYHLYISLIAEQAARYGVKFWTYCLMTNHVHFIAVPSDETGLAMMFREAHRRYTRHINRREQWAGHLWQDRYKSFAMNEAHAIMATRYIENNPVHAGMVKHAKDYRWSSARYHLGLRTADPLIGAGHTMRELVQDWDEFLQQEHQNEQANLLTTHEKSGKPLFSRLGTE